ncbi:hypothetical protein ACTVPA_19105 [Serratia bockelmannii]|uniref:hypothetical protein n=1 Tax=Serratia bockelmannii TaxID=2703793 RepID=UPI003E33710F
MPKFNVGGDNNRIAGNDYYEYRGPEPCPCCEQRYLTAGRSYCRHCEIQFELEKVQQQATERQNARRAVAQKISMVLTVVLALGLVLNWLGPEHLSNVALTVSAVSALGVMIISKIFFSNNDPR